MPAKEERSQGSVRREENGPPCKRCGNHSWDVEHRLKARLRWLAETLVAVPDVWIFQSESGGWPKKQYEIWLCLNCGRRARV